MSTQKNRWWKAQAPLLPGPRIFQPTQELPGIFALGLVLGVLLGFAWPRGPGSLRVDLPGWEGLTKAGFRGPGYGVPVVRAALSTSQ